MEYYTTKNMNSSYIHKSDSERCDEGRKGKIRIHRHTDRHTDTPTDTKIYKHIDTHRETQTHTEKHTETQTYSHITHTDTYRHTEIHIHTCTPHTETHTHKRERESIKMKGHSLERCVWAVKLQSKL